MYYLRQVKVVLEYGEYRERFEMMARALREENIACEIAPLRKSEKETARGKEDGEGVLWIADSVSAASGLYQAGRPVLVFLHERNRDCDLSFCDYACESPEELDARYLDRIYRRFRKLPWDILETERCVVRETTEEDVEEFYRIYAEPSVTEFMDGLYEDPEEELAYARDYRDQVYSFYEFGIWTVTEKRTGEVIGRAGICYREGYEDPEIGFVFAVPWQGQGYATEVCEAILTYAREELGFAKALAFVRPENEISVHLCEKLGMKEMEKTVIQGQAYIVFQTVF